MKFFIDSAKADEIQYALEMWEIDGVTTNPRHIRNSGKPFLQAIQDIAALVQGTDKPVSVEVNPHLDDPDEMVVEAQRLAAMSPNFVIKIPATDAGFRALRTLHGEGIRVNVTLVFSAIQALQAARLGANFVSPFIGWKEARGEEVWGLVTEIMEIYRNYCYSTEVILAAVRNARQIVEAARRGVPIVTAGFDVYKEAFDHPYTQQGLRLFADFWDATPIG